jgi:hypothetical protein
MVPTRKPAPPTAPKSKWIKKPCKETLKKNCQRELRNLHQTATLQLKQYEGTTDILVDELTRDRYSLTVLEETFQSYMNCLLLAANYTETLRRLENAMSKMNYMPHDLSRNKRFDWQESQRRRIDLFYGCYPSICRNLSRFPNGGAPLKTKLDEFKASLMPHYLVESEYDCVMWTKK